MFVVWSRDAVVCKSRWGITGMQVVYVYCMLITTRGLLDYSYISLKLKNKNVFVNINVK